MTIYAFADGQIENSPPGLKEFSIFLGYTKPVYPADRTILGDWIEEQTGVELNWEFLDGDLNQKVGELITSGNYPDLINCGSENQTLYTSGAFICLIRIR